MGHDDKNRGDRSGYLVVLVTAGSEEEAHRIATELVGRRKAACVNIVPRVSSVYRWQGKVESGGESLLIIKTHKSRLDDVIDLVTGMHSYDIAEVIALPVIGGSGDYLRWVGAEVGEAGEDTDVNAR